MIDTNSISVQLYSVRDELARDFSGTVRQVASFGYRAVEAAQFPVGVTPEAAKALFDDLELTVSGIHCPLPLGDNKQVALEQASTLDTDYLICPMLDADTYFSDVNGIKVACEMLNEANQIAKSANLTLVYHNHWFEMQEVAGKIAYQHMLDYLDEDVMFELDTYWARVAGLNPVDVIHELEERLPIIHLKDGMAQNTVDAMLALGAGVMDFPAILEASPAKWHVVELDRCDTDMMAAIKDSYSYLARLNA